MQIDATCEQAKRSTGQLQSAILDQGHRSYCDERIQSFMKSKHSSICEAVPYTDSPMPDIAAIPEKFLYIDGFWQLERRTPGGEVCHTRLSIHSEPSASGHKP